jgi:hypothetical protein
MHQKNVTPKCLPHPYKHTQPMSRGTAERMDPVFTLCLFIHCRVNANGFFLGTKIVGFNNLRVKVQLFLRTGVAIGWCIIK